MYTMPLLLCRNVRAHKCYVNVSGIILSFTVIYCLFMLFFFHTLNGNETWKKNEVLISWFNAFMHNALLDWVTSAAIWPYFAKVTKFRKVNIINWHFIIRKSSLLLPCQMLWVLWQLYYCSFCKLHRDLSI